MNNAYVVCDRDSGNPSYYSTLYNLKRAAEDEKFCAEEDMDQVYSVVPGTLINISVEDICNYVCLERLLANTPGVTEESWEEVLK